MIRISFTAEQIESLAYERDYHPHARVRRKMGVLHLKALRYTHKEIRQIAGICENTLLRYLREYQQGGLAQLQVVRFRRPESALNAHRSLLEAYFRDHPVANANEAAAKIAELTGTRLSVGRVRVYLTQLGLKRRKAGMIPSKADPEVQDQFRHEQLEPRLEQARAGERAIFLSTPPILC